MKQKLEPAPVRKISLQPGYKMPLQPATNFALVAANVPYVRLFADSDLLLVQPGQSLPVRGNVWEIENPFPYDAEIMVAEDHPVNLQGNRVPDEWASVTDGLFTAKYRKADYPAPLPLKKGIMMMPTKGDLKIKITVLNGSVEVRLVPDANVEFLDHKPENCMDETLQATRVNGAVMERVAAIGGIYDDAGIAAWVAAAGYTGTITMVSQSTSDGFELTLLEGTAVIFSEVADGNFTLNAELTDLGTGFNKG